MQAFTTHRQGYSLHTVRDVSIHYTQTRIQAFTPQTDRDASIPYTQSGMQHSLHTDRDTSLINKNNNKEANMHSTQKGMRAFTKHRQGYKPSSILTKTKMQACTPHRQKCRHSLHAYRDTSFH
jgi:hypothetical protein